MPRRISIEQARDLVRSRDELLYSGATDRELRTRVLSGSLRRVHRGFYVDGAVWDDLWPEGRQMLRLLAVNRAAADDGPVFSHTSAAVLWDLPLFGRTADLVHVVTQGRGHTRTEAGVRRHDMEIAEKDIVWRHGLRCTSMVRTVFDLARTLSAEAAVSAADASARTVAVRGRRIDADADSTWREELRSLCSPGLRGVRRARWVSEFADGRAQLPGESVSRLQLDRLGFRDVDLQVPVVGSEGMRYFLDFGFRRSRAFGEFDGEGKYLESGLRTAPTTSDAVLEEKRREDDVRGMTGWRLVRWGSPHIRTPELLGSRLAAFGIRPPG
jgi:hypothetical protein